MGDEILTATAVESIVLRASDDEHDSRLSRSLQHNTELLAASHELLRQQNQRLVRERDEQNKKLDELRSRCRLGLKILEALV